MNCDATGQGKNGSVADNTPPGWVCLCSHTNGFFWLCGTCGHEAEELAMRLQAIVRDEYVHFHGIVLGARKRLAKDSA